MTTHVSHQPVVKGGTRWGPNSQQNSLLLVMGAGSISVSDSLQYWQTTVFFVPVLLLVPPGLGHPSHLVPFYHWKMTDVCSEGVTRSFPSHDPLYYWQTPLLYNTTVVGNVMSVW